MGASPHLLAWGGGQSPPCPNRWLSKWLPGSEGFPVDWVGVCFLLTRYLVLLDVGDSALGQGIARVSAASGGRWQDKRLAAAGS